MLCSKHYLESVYFCTNDCCLFSRKKCQQCIEEDRNKNNYQNMTNTNQSFFDKSKSYKSNQKDNHNLNNNNNNMKQNQKKVDHQLLDYDMLKDQLNEIVQQIKQEFNKVVDNQNAYMKINQIFNIIKEKIKLQLEQAEQHIIYSLKLFYSNIHKSDLSHKINILHSKLNLDYSSSQLQSSNPLQQNNNFRNHNNNNNNNNNTNNQNKSNNSNSNFLSFSNKYLDEFIADLIQSQNEQKQNNPFSPLEIENLKLKEVFKKVKELTYVAENFSSQSINFIFEDKFKPNIIDQTIKYKNNNTNNISISTQNNYETNIMHQHSMQVKCVQNLCNQYIVSCGFDKKIKISSSQYSSTSSQLHSSTLKNKKPQLIQDIQLKHNIVCTDLINDQFICGNEIGIGLLFIQEEGQFKQINEFKLHDSLVYTIRFLNKDEIISGSINELIIYNIKIMKKIQCIKFGNNIITEICKLNNNSFLIGDSQGIISYYKQKQGSVYPQQKLSLIKIYQLHSRPIIKLDCLEINKNHIISASRDQNIIIFNLINGNIVKQITLQNPLVTLCLLSNIEIVSSDSKTIYFHNILTGELIYKIIPQQNTISCIDCNPFNKTIYIGQGKQVCSIQFS